MAKVYLCIGAIALTSYKGNTEVGLCGAIQIGLGETVGGTQESLCCERGAGDDIRAVTIDSNMGAMPRIYPMLVPLAPCC